ncbi:MAG: cytochrome c oxidase subunit 3 [Acidobacteriota bacterium]|nr:cytochrome c oxidase subunit 3 [Acidobacteriota bacterium]
MPATLTTTKHDEPRIGGGGRRHHGLPGSGGGDGGNNNNRQPPEPERTPPPEGYRIGVWLVLVSVTMLFAALTSAYVFNQAQRQPIVMPKVLWLSTAIIIASSATIEIARRALKRRIENKFRLWIGVTAVLGFGFLVAQLIAWRQLSDAGFYVNRNFHSGYSYLFTGLHGVHLLGGLMALAVATLRNLSKWTVLRRRVAVDVTALYWHFIDGLWIFLFVMLFFWR